MPLLNRAQTRNAAQKAYEQSKKAGRATCRVVRWPVAAVGALMSSMSAADLIQIGMLFVTSVLLVITFMGMLNDQRAWVMLDFDKPTWANEQNVGVRVSNFGKGPAFDVTVQVYYSLRETIPDEPPPIDQWHAIPGSRMIPPGQGYNVAYPFKAALGCVPPEAGQRFFLLYEIDYHDQFGFSRRTTACATAVRDYWEKERAVSACDQHNYAR